MLGIHDFLQHYEVAISNTLPLLNCVLTGTVANPIKILTLLKTMPCASFSNEM